MFTRVTLIRRLSASLGTQPTAVVQSSAIKAYPHRVLSCSKRSLHAGVPSLVAEKGRSEATTPEGRRPDATSSFRGTAGFTATGKGLPTATDAMGRPMATISDHKSRMDDESDITSRAQSHQKFKHPEAAKAVQAQEQRQQSQGTQYSRDNKMPSMYGWGAEQGTESPADREQRRRDLQSQPQGQPDYPARSGSDWKRDTDSNRDQRVQSGWDRREGDRDEVVHNSSQRLSNLSSGVWGRLYSGTHDPIHPHEPRSFHSYAAAWLPASTFTSTGAKPIENAAAEHAFKADDPEIMRASIRHGTTYEQEAKRMAEDKNLMDEGVPTGLGGKPGAPIFNEARGKKENLKEAEGDERVGADSSRHGDLSSDGSGASGASHASSAGKSMKSKSPSGSSSREGASTAGVTGADGQAASFSYSTAPGYDATQAAGTGSSSGKKREHVFPATAFTPATGPWTTTTGRDKDDKPSYTASSRQAASADAESKSTESKHRKEQAKRHADMNDSDAKASTVATAGKKTGIADIDDARPWNANDKTPSSSDPTKFSKAAQAVAGAGSSKGKAGESVDVEGDTDVNKEAKETKQKMKSSSSASSSSSSKTSVSENDSDGFELANQKAKESAETAAKMKGAGKSVSSSDDEDNTSSGKRKSRSATKKGVQVAEGMRDGDASAADDLLKMGVDAANAEEKSKKARGRKSKEDTDSHPAAQGGGAGGDQAQPQSYLKEKEEPWRPEATFSG